MMLADRGWWREVKIISLKVPSSNPRCFHVAWSMDVKGIPGETVDLQVASCRFLLRIVLQFSAEALEIFYHKVWRRTFYFSLSASKALCRKTQPLSGAYWSLLRSSWFFNFLNFIICKQRAARYSNRESKAWDEREQSGRKTRGERSLFGGDGIL